MSDFIVPNRIHGVRNCSKHSSHSAICQKEKDHSTRSRNSSNYRSHSSTSSTNDCSKVRIEHIEKEPWVRQMQQIDEDKPTLLQELLMQLSIRKME